MSKRILHFLGPLFAITVLSIALYVLHRLLHVYHYREIAAQIKSLPNRRIVSAIALTAASYLILTLYDTLGVRYIQHPLPYRRIALASFIGYAFNNNLGMAGVAGNSLRYRIYSAWGLSAIEIAKVIAFCILTFWLGFMAVGAVSFIAYPLPLPRFHHFPIHTVKPMGYLFLFPVGAYLLWTVFRTQPIRVYNWSFTVPSPGTSLIQILVAAVDWIVAAGVLYTLLPAGHGIHFFYFLTIYLLAITIGFISHVPGGLGVFEALMLYTLGPIYGDPVVAGTLLAFRGIYYLLPLGVAVILLGGHELIRRLEKVRQTASLIGQWAPTLAPNVFAFTTFIAGAILIFSGAMPSRTDRLAGPNHFLPFPVTEFSYLLGSAAGAGMLLLARGLQRRLEIAYRLSVPLLIAGIAFSLFRGFDYVEALILTLLLAALLPCRPHFYRRAALTSQPLPLGWTAAILLTLIAAVWLGFFSHQHLTRSLPLWWHFSTMGETPRFMRATLAAVFVALLLGPRFLWRSARPEPVPPGRAPWADVRQIVRQSKRAEAHAALMGDKFILPSKNRKAFIMYGMEGRSWVALGDPVGPEEEMSELAWEFREMADAHDGWTVFYQVPVDRLPLYLDLGLVLLKLGEEALVPLDRFTVQALSRKSLREAHRHFVKEGCRFEIVRPAETAPLNPEFKEVSDAWLAAQKTHEKGFSLGRFSESYLRQLPLAVVRRERRIVAFAAIWPGADGGELSIDMMRYRPEMPGGIMDYLFIELMLWGNAQGYRQFNMGMAPLSDLENRSFAPLWHKIGTLVFRHGEHFHHFQELRRFKEQYDPVWVPKYMASPGGMVLPRILTHIATLISG